MAHGTNLSAAVGDGDDMLTVDGSLIVGSGYPNAASYKTPANVLYHGADTSTVPTPTTDAHPYPITPRTSSGTAQTYGAGAVASGTQRVTLGSDDPAVSVLGATGDAAATAGSTGSLSAKVRLMTSLLDTINTALAGTLTVNSELPAAGALADNTANPTVPAVGSFLMVWDGSTWDRAIGNATDGLTVNLGTNNDVTLGAALPAGDNNIGNVDIVTVPAPLSTTGGGTEATALRVTIASDSTGVLSVDDNGSSITVDNGGTFAVQVDGAALTSLQLLDDTIKTDDAAFTPASDKVLMVGATFDNVASDSVDEGDAGALRMSARRELHIQIRDAAGNERGANVDASGQLLVLDGNSTAIAASLSVMDDWDESDRAKINPIVGQAGVAAGAGAVGATVQRVTLASDDPAVVALQIIDNPVLADDAAFTPGTTSVMMAGFQADETSTDSVNEGDGGAARMTLDRKQIVTQQPHTQGGCATFKSTDIDETEEDCKTSAGQIYGIYAVNVHASSPRYLKVYNATAANVTVGSTATKLDMLVPPNYSGFLLNMPNGIEFDTAICFAATTGVGDSDTGAPGASEVQINVFYK